MTIEEDLATLRKLTGYLYSEHMSTEANESHEVIDQVETYVERLERLREQNDGLYEAVKLSKNEQDRLREALREIAVYVPGNVHIGEAAVKLKDIARRALREEA